MLTQPSRQLGRDRASDDDRADNCWCGRITSNTNSNTNSNSNSNTNTHNDHANGPQSGDLVEGSAHDDDSTQITLDTELRKRASIALRRAAAAAAAAAAGEVARSDQQQQAQDVPTLHELPLLRHSISIQSVASNCFVGRDREIYALERAYQQHIVADQQETPTTRASAPSSSQAFSLSHSRRTQPFSKGPRARRHHKLPIVLVHGCSGIGKTRFVREFVKQKLGKRDDKEAAAASGDSDGDNDSIDHVENKRSSTKPGRYGRQIDSSSSSSSEGDNDESDSDSDSDSDSHDDDGGENDGGNTGRHGNRRGPQHARGRHVRHESNNDDDSDDDSSDSEEDSIDRLGRGGAALAPSRQAHRSSAPASTTPSKTAAAAAESQTPLFYAIYGKYEEPRTPSASKKPSSQACDPQGDNTVASSTASTSSSQSAKDPVLHSSPFLAFTQAISDLCFQVGKDDAECRRLRARLNDDLVLDQDMRCMLLAWIPALSVLLSEAPDGTDAAATSTCDATSQPVTGTGMIWNRFQFTVQRFLKAVATAQCPIVLILDDIQWSSAVGMDLLSTICLDPDLRYTMIIGCIRTEDMKGACETPSSADAEASGRDAATVPTTASWCGLEDDPSKTSMGEVHPKPRAASSSSTPQASPSRAQSEQPNDSRHKSTASLSSTSSAPQGMTLERLRRRRLEKQRRKMTDHQQHQHQLTSSTSPAVVAKLLLRFEEADKQWNAVQLKPWNAYDISSYICLLFRLNRKKATRSNDFQDFVQHLLRTTKGNALYIQQLLDDYKRSKVVYYSHARSTWDFNLDNLSQPRQPRQRHNKSTNGDSDVPPIYEQLMGLIVTNLQQLHPKLRTMLVLASYIKCAFDAQTMGAVINYEEIHQQRIREHQQRQQEEGARAIEAYDEQALNNQSVPCNKLIGDVDDGDIMLALPQHHEVAEFLEQAVLFGILTNVLGGSTYQFTHNRIQKASHTLCVMNTAQQRNLRYRIGRCLLRYYTQSDNRDATSKSQAQAHPSTSLKLESQWDTRIQSSFVDHALLFVAADHLNAVLTTDDGHANNCDGGDNTTSTETEVSSSSSISNERMEGKDFLMVLNLKVGEKALQMAALGLAATHLELAAKAMSELPCVVAGGGIEKAWDEHYDTVLRLHQARSEVELTLGRFDEGYAIGEVVLRQAKGLLDRLRTRLSMATALGRNSRHVEGLEMSCTGVQLLGEYPSRFYRGHILKKYVSLRSYFKRHSDSDIVGLPINTDPSKLMAMKLMAQVIIRSFILQNYKQWLLAMLRMIQLTARSGLCENSAIAMASYGILAAIKGDQKSALRYGTLAKRILDKVGSKVTDGWVYFVCSTYIDAWTEPSVDIVKNYRKAHAVSMQAGDFEVAFLNWHMANAHAYWDGFNLDMLHIAGSYLLDQMSLYKVHSLVETKAEQQRMLGIMLGKIPLDWEELEKYDQRKESDDSHYPVYWHWMRLHIAVYFFQFELAERMATKLNVIADSEPGYLMMTVRLFLTGIMAAARYRQTGNRKYLRLLRQMYKRSKHLNKSRGNNSLHRTLLMKAELASTTTPNAFRQNKINYDSAIQRAENAGNIHEAGFACELAGEYMLRYGMFSMVEDYMSRAYSLYKEWGGVAKMESLKQRHREHLKKSLLGAEDAKSTCTTTPEELTIVTNPSIKYDLISVSSPNHFTV